MTEKNQPDNEGKVVAKIVAAFDRAEKTHNKMEDANQHLRQVTSKGLEAAKKALGEWSKLCAAARSAQDNQESLVRLSSIIEAHQHYLDTNSEWSLKKAKAKKALEDAKNADIQAKDAFSRLMKNIDQLELDIE
jgi:hypothetical protein